MIEIWKDIKGYEGLYQVSNLGRVKSMARETPFTNRWGQRITRTKKEFIMKDKTTCNGYKGICLRNNGMKWIGIHRLVAIAFIPNPENKPEVDHIDGNKKNNCVDNLRWVTKEENNNNPIRLERCLKMFTPEVRDKMSKGHFKPVFQYSLDGEIINTFQSLIEARQYLGVKSNRHLIAALKDRIPYRGYIWRYKNEKGMA